MCPFCPHVGSAFARESRPGRGRLVRNGRDRATPGNGEPPRPLDQWSIPSGLVSGGRLVGGHRRVAVPQPHRVHQHRAVRDVAFLFRPLIQQPQRGQLPLPAPAASSRCHLLLLIRLGCSPRRRHDSQSSRSSGSASCQYFPRCHKKEKNSRSSLAYASRVPSASHVNRDRARNRASTGSIQNSGSLKIGWYAVMPASASRWSRSAHPASAGTRRHGTGRPRAVQYSSHSRSAPASSLTAATYPRQQGIP